MSESTKKTTGYALNLFLITLSISITHAEPVIDVPDKIPGTTLIYSEDVIDLNESVPNLLIIDSRISSDRKHGYIEGSVNLPDIETDCKKLANIITTKKSPVLFYCNGIKCGRSGEAAIIALQCGYTNIYWFRGGFEEWKSKNFPFIKP